MDFRKFFSGFYIWWCVIRTPCIKVVARDQRRIASIGAQESFAIKLTLFSKRTVVALCYCWFNM